MLEITLIDVSHQYHTSVKTLSYDIYVESIDRVVGQCEYRFETDALDLKYYGHLGYNIYMPYRGHNYAYKACLELFKILKKDYNITELMVTCNPDNYASSKIIKKLNGEYLSTVDVIRSHPLYKLGEIQKEIYIIRL